MANYHPGRCHPAPCPTCGAPAGEPCRMGAFTGTAKIRWRIDPSRLCDELPRVRRTVAIESPFAGADQRERTANESYLRACLRDCLLRGEAPFASHGLYTLPGVLDDDVPAERRLGIVAGFHVADALDARVVYEDRGISEGMHEGIRHARTIGQPVEFRRLGKEWSK